MSTLFLLFVTVVNAFAASAILTRVAIDLLNKKAILDKPNARSSHDVPTPRGAGLAIIPLIIFGLAMSLMYGDFVDDTKSYYVIVLLSASFLCLVTVLDDLREHGISAVIRFSAQILAVVCPLYFMSDEQLIFQGWLPIWLDRIVAGIAWLWFINLFNFMDGINGISGVQTISIAIGTLLMGIVFATGDSTMLMTSALMFGGAAGFLVWNWGLAKVFLGDIGSIGFGYLCGLLLMLLAAKGAFWAAIIIPLYYLMDATITIIKRLINKEKIWEAHRKHYYQAATVKGGLTHAQACISIAGVNVALIVLALFSKTAGAWMMLPAVLVVYCLLRFFRQANKKAKKKS